MKYLHAMIRVLDPEKSMHFYCDLLGLKKIREYRSEAGEFTLYYLAEHEDAPPIELTHNWGHVEPYSNGRNFGHLAFEVDNIYETCQLLQDNGITILRPPRDGRMAFVKDPDGISLEFLQKGEALEPAEPWASMESTGSW